MKIYTFDELSDLLDAVDCKRDIKEIEDYLFSNLSKYHNKDIMHVWGSIEVWKEIYY